MLVGRIAIVLAISLGLCRCSSIIESLGKSQGAVALTYVSTEKLKTVDVVQGFRQFVSQEKLQCARPLNAEPDLLDSCTGQDGIYVFMLQEPDRLKFMTQIHPMFWQQNEEKAKGTIRAVNARLVEQMRSRFGDAVQAD